MTECVGRQPSPTICTDPDASMDVIHSVAALRERLQREPNNVFVPTMGNLHAGPHRADQHRQAARRVHGGEHFRQPPAVRPARRFRPLSAHAAGRIPRSLQEAGVDVVFAPDEREIYPEPQTYVVEPSDLQHILEGAHRPGHFRGVATVVLKLFNMVQPHSAIFGKKDYQQYLVLRDMVRQFALPIEIIPAETVRAPMASRCRRATLI